MKSKNKSLEGLTLVAVKNGEPVENQSEAVAAMLRPVIAAVLKHTGADLDAPAPTTTALKTTEDRMRRIADLEIECATLRHGLRLADRRYEDAIAAAPGHPEAETGSRPATGSADPMDDRELRRAVKEMTRMLGSREWAEHISSEPDASALESAITTLVGEVGAILDGEGLMVPTQEPNHGIRGGRLYDRTSGDKIPDSEPVFIFRATDKKAVAALHFYADICDDAQQANAVQGRIADFQAFTKRQAGVANRRGSSHAKPRNLDQQDEML